MLHDFNTYRYQNAEAAGQFKIAYPESSMESMEPLEETNMPVQNEEEKTYEFEKFIVEKFHSRHFHLMGWRSGPLNKSKYLLSDSAPDLIYEYRNKSKTVSFAVECVWKGCYVNGSIEWANNRQIKSYYDFQFREGIDVFVMIGIGNIPADPAELYIVPLNHIPLHRGSLHQDFLEQYRRASVVNNFFLDV